MASNRAKGVKNFYAITNGRKHGIFRHWSQVKPLVDKHQGAAYKGFETLNQAVCSMINGGFALESIVFHDINVADVKVTEYARKNGVEISLPDTQPSEGSSAGIEEATSDNETEEKFLDAPNSINTLVHIHGCCLNNGNVAQAGIGVYWGPESSSNIGEPIQSGKKTKNTADLLAAIKALEQVKEKQPINESRDVNLTVMSDNTYLIDGITKWLPNWKSNNWTTSQGSEVENKDLWLKLDELNFIIMPEWSFVPREMNTYAEKLAKDGANKVNAETEVTLVNSQVCTGCVICEREESKEMLPCCKCNRKVHFSCTALPQYQLAVYRKSQRRYTCERCVVDAGDIEPTEARKSFGERSNFQQNICTVSDHANVDSVHSVNVSDDLKCIKDDVKSLRGSVTTLEQEILRVVSRLCDENLQLRENACDEKIKACEKEKDALSAQLQKSVNSEADLRNQIQNQKDKNVKLSVECDRLRENLLRCEEAKSQSVTQAVKEKSDLITYLRSELEKAQKENEDLKSDRVAVRNSLVEDSSVLESIHTDITLQNRFETPRAPKKLKVQDENRIPGAVYVKGHTEPLSNFYRTKFEWRREKFHSVEQAFQYEKAMRHKANEIAGKIWRSKHAGIANKIGRDVRIHRQWDTDKEFLMVDLLRAKAEQCQEFREKLIESGDRVICADIPDKFWGVGTDGKGLNKLGEMLGSIRQEVKSRVEREKNMPRCTIIGSSLLKNMNPNTFSEKVVTKKRTAYTIPEAVLEIKRLEKERSDVIVYQLLSNDMKSNSENDCLRSLKRLVTITKESHPEARIIVSLPPNRGDSRLYNNMTNTINAGVKSLYAVDDIVHVCDNSNLAFRGEANPEFISIDGIHPTPAGDQVLFNNIRLAVEEVLTP